MSNEDRYLVQLRQLILERLANYSVKVYLCGSRAKGNYRKASDVDVALWPDKPLPLGVLAGLREVIEESTIPYQVDLIDLSQTSATFRDKILKGAILWND